jgi:hypothetical protein
MAQGHISLSVFPFGRHDAEEGSLRLSEVFDGDAQGLERPGEGDINATSSVHQHFLYPAFLDHQINE